MIDRRQHPVPHPTPRPGLGAGRGPVSTRRDWFPLHFFAVFGLVCALVVIEPALMHWFLIPVCISGLLLGPDVIAWLTGRRDPFDPGALLALLGLHLFFVSPLLIVLWGFEYDVARSPDDWRPWLGIMASLNAGGLLLYRSTREFIVRHWPVRRPRQWVIDDRRALSILVPVLLISGLAQAFIWMNFGGLSGQIRGLRTEELIFASGQFKYTIVGHAFPLILLITLTVLKRRSDRDHGTFTVAFFTLLFIGALFFLVGGLRGSRSATVWTLFWATGIIHYFWRRLSARIILAGLIPVIAFMYLYGLYKAYGYQVFDRLESEGSITEMSQRSGRTPRRLAIADMSRTDIQAFLAYRLVTAGDSYQLRWGRTYAETVPRTFLPSWIWSGRPRVPAKAKAGMELHFGGPSPYGELFSKVHGLAGEAMLNFHFPGVLIAFFMLGIVAGLYHRQFYSWREYDARLFIAPFMANWFISALIGDFDNLLAFTLAKGFVPIAVLLLITKRRAPR